MNAKCPHCEKIYNKVDEKMIGLAIKCKSCRETFTVGPISSGSSQVLLPNMSNKPAVSTNSAPGKKSNNNIQVKESNSVPPNIPKQSEINRKQVPSRQSAKPPQIESSDKLFNTLNMKDIDFKAKMVESEDEFNIENHHDDEFDLPNRNQPRLIIGLVAIGIPVVAVTLFLIFSGSSSKSSSQNNGTNVPDVADSAKPDVKQVEAKGSGAAENPAESINPEIASGSEKKSEKENERSKIQLKPATTKPGEVANVTTNDAADPSLNPGYESVLDELLSIEEESRPLADSLKRKFYSEISQHADSGHVRSQFLRSLCVIKGIGTVQNIKKGEAELKLVAQNGYIDAIKQLGLMYFIGYFVDEDEAESRRIFQLGCEKNDPHSCAWYGWFLTEGIGGPEDDEKGIAFLKQAAAAGEQLGIYRLAVCYLNDDDVSNNATAEQMFLKNADAGGLRSLHMLGLANLRGSFGTVQTQKGMEFLIKAAQADSLESQEELATIYLMGKYGVTKNRDTAVFWLDQAIKNGSSFALVYRGMVAEMDGDEQSAVDYWTKAEAEGENFATYLSGNLILKSGIKKNSADLVSKGIEMIERSAKKGNITAIVTLARIYGFGIKIIENFGKQTVLGLNPPEAFRICQIAADEDDAGAMRLLADFYSNGIGTRRDANLAQKWRTKADRADNQAKDR